MQKKVIIAMSGGVDSSVAAFLLKAQGYDVIGITMQVWQPDKHEDVGAKAGCCGLSAVEDARFVADALSIPHYVLNFRELFNEKVIDYFVHAYMEGLTPNPCIACNRFVKWEHLFQKSMDLGADYVATGHYAHMGFEGGRHFITASKAAKDQSYALYNLTQNQLAHTLFPLSHLEKDLVRDIAAKEIGLRVAYKPDSQEICFIPSNDHPSFLEEYLGKPLPTGNFVDEHGQVIRPHEGIGRYTIGQRKGLGSFGVPMFVKNIDITSGDITIAKDEGLYGDYMEVDDLNFMAIGAINDTLSCFAKIRYSHKAAAAAITYEGGRITCRFKEPQRAITPGQSAVFYDEAGRILCGGRIITK